MTTHEATEVQIAIAQAAREGRRDGPKTVPPAFHLAGRGVQLLVDDSDEELLGEEEYLGEEDSWSEGEEEPSDSDDENEAMTYEQQQALLQQLAAAGEDMVE